MTGSATNEIVDVVALGAVTRLLVVRSASSSLMQVVGPQQPMVADIVVRVLWQHGIAAHEPPLTTSGTSPETAIATTATVNARKAPMSDP